MKVSELKNLAVKSELQLAEVGVCSAEDLRDMGSAEAFVRLKAHFKKGISLNFLYAMEAGLRGEHWQLISDEDKLSLQTEVAALEELYSTFHKVPMSDS
ncbi:TfoX/Sxy family DNA transformation protein [Litoribacillus peritrichatus]|uniref:TfoX C-terminal domain-containing protein n=1 Tax=Litoribacillus peritrichatus TaxID=718191 RepID=A0ABP7MF31_9GAMM